MSNEAGNEAQKLWNSKACGELEGNKNTVEYFLNVEKDRYAQQPWAQNYFEYHKFAGKKVLEIGVGQGTDLMQFARSGAICFGVDITDNHLNLTKRNFDLQGKQVELHKTDACNLPFPDNYFDSVYSFGVMQYIRDIEKVLSEAQRVLKPNGRLMIALYYKWVAFHRFWKILCHGIRCGWLFTKGYKGLLATIESSADAVNIKPYVKLYTRKDCKNLLSSFSITDISIHQLEKGHFWPVFLQNLSAKFVPMLESKLGWYIAVKALK